MPISPRVDPMASLGVIGVLKKILELIILTISTDEKMTEAIAELRYSCAWYSSI
ncbi:hypothetical protein GCM10023150_00760 [Kangiella taiwanensis]|uniref:Uncharacterized protein n=1 Tax=Kangiella taiwanensis TaxID=1079179 RepID=A0ABP8HQL2_9GAMM